MPDNIQDNFNSGFIKIYRSIKKNWIWEDAEKLKWWLDILLEVNYSDKRVPMGGEVIDCKRGQSINSLDTWAKRWRVDKSKVRRFFQLLKSDKMILLENVKKTTRLTVCNYDTYNDHRINSETIVNQSRINVESIATPNNKDNKDNKEKKEEVAVDVFFEMFRRAAGKHITDETLITEIGKFKNKYPNIHPSQAGPLVNGWVANIGSTKPDKKEMIV